MKLRQDHSLETAAAKAGISRATGYRMAQDPLLPSRKKQVRVRRRPDPLGHIFEADVVPLLKAAPGIRPVAIYDEMLRRHPDLSRECAGRWSVVFARGGQFTEKSRR